MQATLLPHDLAAWDEGAGADLFAAPVWSDVRPLRGAAGLVDWRLCGKVSASLRERRFSGEPDEKLLLTSRRLPWRAVLLCGAGETAAFSERVFRAWMETVLASMKSLAARSLAVALPGRDADRLPPDHALSLLLGVLGERPGAVESLVLVDAPAAVKALARHPGITRPVRPARAAVRATES